MQPPEQTDVQALTNQIASLIADKRTGVARPLLAAARCLAPKSDTLALLSAKLAMCEGQMDLAQCELDSAVAENPRHPGLRKCRAALRSRLGDNIGAVSDAAEAVILAPSDPSSKALLGLVLLDLGRPDEAVSCMAEALAAEPANPAYREALAAAQEAAGNPDAALATLTEGLPLAPGSKALWNAAILRFVRRGEFARAVELADDACSRGIADACLFGMKAHALSSLGQNTEAAEAYYQALTLGPEDAYVRHMVASAGRLPANDRAHTDYVAAVFNGYADYFDTHLLALGYRVPGLIRSAVLQHPLIRSGEVLGPALDLGCGTGLVAVALSDLRVGPLVGVDVSRRMLAEARRKQIYDDLQEADLFESLRNDTAFWPLIVAGDVICYVGRLDELLGLVHARLTRGGWFLFSVEECVSESGTEAATPPGWRLQGNGRYAHTFDYIMHTALEAGFAVSKLERQVLRHEGNQAVAGLIAVLERTGDAP